MTQVQNLFSGLYTVYNVHLSCDPGNGVTDGQFLSRSFFGESFNFTPCLESEILRRIIIFSHLQTSMKNAHLSHDLH